MMVCNQPLMRKILHTRHYLVFVVVVVVICLVFCTVSVLVTVMAGIVVFLCLNVPFKLRTYR